MVEYMKSVAEPMALSTLKNELESGWVCMG